MDVIKQILTSKMTKGKNSNKHKPEHFAIYKHLQDYFNWTLEYQEEDRKVHVNF